MSCSRPARRPAPPWRSASRCSPRRPSRAGAGASGAPPAISVVVLGYFVGMVANTIPIPGAVSGGMVGVLLAFGVEADLALASVLAYRALAIWLPAPVGLAALGSLRRSVARWGAEPAPEPESAAPRSWGPFGE